MEAWQDRMQPVAPDLLESQVRENKVSCELTIQYIPLFILCVLQFVYANLVQEVSFRKVLFCQWTQFCKNVQTICTNNCQGLLVLGFSCPERCFKIFIIVKKISRSIDDLAPYFSCWMISYIFLFVVFPRRGSSVQGQDRRL